MRTVRRGGPYLRVADPAWADPLDGRFAADRGGRWNPPESFPVVYLCGSIEVARANVYRRLAGQPYGPEDLLP
jgi:RES domain-containing protein